MDVQGLRCLVTGAASGIGEAVTRRLVSGGATVVSLDRHTPRVEVERHVPVDLADQASIDAAVAGLEGEFDVLANVAGIPGNRPAELVLAVNFLGMRHLTEAVVPRLRAEGSVVVVASTAGRQWVLREDAVRALVATDSFEAGLAWFREHPQEGNAYNFAKEAATYYAMFRAVSFLREHGVRVNSVLPGPVETPILADFEESMGKAALDGVRAVAGRHASVDDIAPVVTFLAGRESVWLNGAQVVADHGVAGAVTTGALPAVQTGRPGDTAVRA